MFLQVDKLLLLFAVGFPQYHVLDSPYFWWFPLEKTRPAPKHSTRRWDSSTGWASAKGTFSGGGGEFESILSNIAMYLSP